MVQEKGESLVGRERESERFGTLMAQVSDGDSAALILTGQEGVGKTALLQAFQARTAAAGWVVLTGNCDESTADEPYGPFLSALGLCLDTQGRLTNDRGVTSIVDSLPLDDILSAVTDIPFLGAVAALGLVGKRVIDARRRPLEGEELVNYNFEFVRQVFQQIARRRKSPILLSFDDLQHAGDTTIALASYLLTRAAGTRLLFIGAWQPTPEVKRPPAGVRKLGLALSLSPFGREQTRTLVERIAPGLKLPPERVTRIVEFSHGLPGLVIEIVHLLEEDADLLEDSETDEPSPATTPVSTMVNALAHRYLKSYPPETLSLIECAAILGRRFPLSPLISEPVRAYLGLNERRVLEILTQLARQGHVLAFTEVEDTLQFTSDYLHSYLQRSLSTPLARRDHLRLAQGWQQVSAGPPPGPLARHFFQGRDYAAALKYALCAAADLVRQAAYPEAVEAYNLALQALDRLPSGDEHTKQRLDLFIAAAFAAEQAGEWVAAVARLEEALSLAGDDEPRQAEILGNLGWLHFKQGEFARSLERLSQSAKLYARQDNPDGQVQINYYLGVVHTAQKNWGQAIEHFQSCIAAEKELAGDAILARVYLELGNLIRQQRRWTEAEELLQKGIALANKTGDPSALAEGYHYLGVSLGRQEKPEALEHLNRALDIAQNRTRQPHQEAKILNTLAETYVRFNRWDEAVIAFEGSEAIKRRLGDKPGLAMTYGGLGRLYHRQWRAELAADYYRKDLDILRQEAGANTAWIQQLLNSLAEAMSLADGILDERERDRSRGYTHLGLARLELSRQQPAAARPHVEQAQARLQSTWMEPESQRVRAWLERLSGKLQEAQAWLDKALPRLEQSEDYERLVGAHEAAQLAQASGEAAAARHWWAKTLEIAKRLDNEPLTRAAQEALALPDS